MLRITLLTAVSVLAITSASAEDVAATSPANNSPTAFQGAIASIKNWFGSDAPVTVQPIAGYDGMSPEATAAAANAVEPAAGDDLIQVPPQYTGADANAIEPAAGEGTATAPAAPAAPAAATCKADEGETGTICAEPKADATASPVDAATPASEPAEPMTPAQPLPSTQPAAGTPTPAAPAAAPMPVPAKAQ